MTTDTDREYRDRVLAEERQRIANVLIEVANERGWCDEADVGWEAVYPGVPLRDSDGFDRKGWKVTDDGWYVDRDGNKRPPKPDDCSHWCNGCREWE